MFRLKISNKTLFSLYIKIIYIISAVIIIELLMETFFNYRNLIYQYKKLNVKTIQLLTGRFHFKNWELGHELGDEPFKECPEKRCYAFKTMLGQTPYEEADGIMVHG
jgi:hypothetical protein